MKRVVVVGAGVGGLAAAVELSARPGVEVVVVEAADRVGGKMGVAFHDGVRFDTGPSLFTLPEVLRGVVESRGKVLEEELELFRPAPVFRYLLSREERLDVAARLEETGENVRRSLGAKAAGEFREFMGYSRKIWEAAAPHFVMGQAPTAFSAVKLGLRELKALRDIDSMTTMAAAIDKRVSHRGLRDVFLRYATFNGSDPRCAPATLNCVAWVDMGIGAYGVDGGMHEVALLLERLAREGGVEVRLSEPVRSVRTGGRGMVVETAAGVLEADAVVMNADVRHLIEDLWADAKPHGVKAGGPPSTSGFNLVVRARRRTEEERPGHQVLFCDGDYMQEFEDLFDGEVPPREPTLYLCAKEKAHRSQGWEEEEPLFVMANAPAVREGQKDVNWEAYEKLVMKRLLGAGLIDEDDEVVWRRTPQGLAERFPGSRGSLYGAASNSRLSAFSRPPNRAPKVKGLYLASGSAHPGGGVPLCMQSGRQAARELVGDLLGGD